ncbi:odorant receptor 13a-like [Anoplolepis gracilipes]|uniref:odorant receptor 13a-like n=1 Tax=Anoplolepis gracilipes TaxID=354296 RepID=UPI003BA06321
MSKSSSYRDFVWAIEPNRSSLELIGLWPKADETLKRRFDPDIRAGFFFMMILIFLAIPLIHALTRVWGDMVLMIDNLRVTLPVLTIILKFGILRWKQSVLLSIINMMRDDWTTVKLNAERDVMMKHVRTIRFITFGAHIATILTFIMLTVIFPLFGLSFRWHTNLTDRNKPFPLQTYYFYDTDKSPQFELTYLTQVISTLVATITSTSADTFLAFIILHICGQLENFRHRLVTLVADKEFNNILRYHILTHIRLIRYANNIEDMFTLIMLGTIIYFGIIFCLAIFVLLVIINNEKINATNFSRVCYMIQAIIIYFVQMFLYCYGGELIIEQCEAVYRAVYDLKWYKWEIKQTRNLIILLIRVQEPFRITAGKIVPLTMTTFCSLLKTSAGYISCLLAVQN